MRGEETVGVAKKVDEAGSVGAVDEQKPAGLQQIQGVVDNLSRLRRRKRAKNPPLSAAAGGESLINTTTESQIKETGNAGDEAGGGEVVYRANHGTNPQRTLRRNVRCQGWGEDERVQETSTNHTSRPSDRPHKRGQDTWVRPCYCATPSGPDIEYSSRSAVAHNFATAGFT